LYRDRHLTRFSAPVTDTTFAIANNSQRGEAHNTTAFNGLGHSIDLNQFLLKIAFSPLIATTALLIVVRHA
jgi:hypothetical protein